MHRIFTSLDSETYSLFGISKVLCFSLYRVCTAGLLLEQNTRKQFFKQSLRNNWSFKRSKSLNQKIILISFNWQLGAGLFWLLINTIVQPKNWLRNSNTYTQLVGLVPILEHDIICPKTSKNLYGVIYESTWLWRRIAANASNFFWRAFIIG